MIYIQTRANFLQVYFQFAHLAESQLQFKKAKQGENEMISLALLYLSKARSTHHVIKYYYVCCSKVQRMRVSR